MSLGQSACAGAQDTGHIVLLNELGRLRYGRLCIEQAILDDELYRSAENRTVHLRRRLDPGQDVVADGFGWAASDRQDTDLDGILRNGQTVRAGVEDQYEPT